MYPLAVNNLGAPRRPASVTAANVSTGILVACWTFGTWPLYVGMKCESKMLLGASLAIQVSSLPLSISLYHQLEVASLFVKLKSTLFPAAVPLASPDRRPDFPLLLPGYSRELGQYRCLSGEGIGTR